MTEHKKPADRRVKSDPEAPDAAHVWAEKFKGLPRVPRRALLARVEELRKAQDRYKALGKEPLKWWQREIEWRLRQLSGQGGPGDGDPEHQE